MLFFECRKDIEFYFIVFLFLVYVNLVVNLLIWVYINLVCYIKLVSFMIFKWLKVLRFLKDNGKLNMVFWLLVF